MRIRSRKNHIALASFVSARDHIQPLSKIINAIVPPIRERCAIVGELPINPEKAITAQAVEWIQQIVRYICPPYSITLKKHSMDDSDSYIKCRSDELEVIELSPA